MGMSGVILTGFLFALPANELAIPVILMLLTQQSVLGDAQGAEAAALLAASGITAKTALVLSDFLCISLAAAQRFFPSSAKRAVSGGRFWQRQSRQ